MVKAKKNGQNRNNSKQPKNGQTSNRMFSGGAANSISAKIDRVLSRIPKGSFAAAGGALGGPVGAAAGAALSTISGYGDYVVKHNTITTSGGVGAVDIVPRFAGNGGVGSNVRISHREYVGDVKVPDAPGFNVTQYGITPTNAQLFPWLSDFAKKFQRWKVHGMAFYYKSTSTDYNNSGVIAMTVNYDPADPQYLSMEGMMNSKFAVSTKPSLHLAAPVECAPTESPQAGYFVEHDAAITSAEIRQTHKGMLNIGTDGLSAAPGTSLGQIYAVYDIEMMYPYHSINLQEASPFGASGVHFNTGADTDINSVQLLTLPGFSTAPEDRLLYTAFYTTTTSPHRIDIQGTPGHMKFKFKEAGRYFFTLVYKNQTVLMGSEPTITNGTIVTANAVATLGSAETNKCGWAQVVVDAAAESILTWWDTSYSGFCQINVYADKLS